VVERSGQRSAGEALYVRDEDSGEAVGPTALPIREEARRTSPHGQGYSRFEHDSHGIALELAAVRAARRSRQDLAPPAHNRSGRRDGCR
jgi:cellobiose phosphorylase